MKNSFVVCIIADRPIIACFNKEATAHNWAMANADNCNYVVVNMPKVWANCIIKMVANGIASLCASYAEDDYWHQLSAEEQEVTANFAETFWKDGQRNLNYAKFLMCDEEGRNAFFA